MAADVLPEGQEVELEFVRESKPAQRGLLPEPIDFTLPGFRFRELEVPQGLGFHEPFRVEVREKWVNLATVAEVRYLPAGALRDEVARLAALHREVRSRLDRP